MLSIFRKSELPPIPEIDLNLLLKEALKQKAAGYKKKSTALENQLAVFNQLIKDLTPVINTPDQPSKFYCCYEWNKKDFQDISLPITWDMDRILFFDPGNHQKTGVLDILRVDLDGNRKKETFYIPKEKTMQFVAFMKAIYSFPWMIMVRSLKKKLDWSELDTYYDLKTKEHYQLVHKLILSQLIMNVDLILEKRKRANLPLDINIIDAGCGQAPQLLIGAYRYLKQLIKIKYSDVAVTIKGLGFDFEETNSEWCARIASREAECKKTPDILFVQGDANYLELIVREGGKRRKGNPRVLATCSKDLTQESKPHLTCSANTYTTVLSSGSFTRMTLGTGFNCLRVLQACWRSLVDQVIIGGITEFLFVRRMLKRIGYDINEYEFIPDKLNPVMTLVRLSEDKMCDRIIKKLEKCLQASAEEKGKTVKLDLAMNPYPEKILDRLTKTASNLMSQVTSLDLSFSDIRHVKTLSTLLNELPSLTEITYYCNSPAFLKQLLFYIPSHIRLHVRYTENEFVLAHSQRVLEKTGQIVKEHEDNEPDFHLSDGSKFFLISNLVNALHASGLPSTVMVEVYDALVNKMQQNMGLTKSAEIMQKALAEWLVLQAQTLSADAHEKLIRLQSLLFPSKENTVVDAVSLFSRNRP